MHPLTTFLNKYKQWGFAIIPIQYRSKKPSILWEEYQRKKPDNAELGEWFSEPKTNIAVICGKISGNLVVLDFDKAEPYEDFKVYWKDFNGKSLLESTPVVQTGGGGFHVYFRVRKLPQLYHPTSERKNYLPDIQSERGYVLAPPSVHPNDKLYEFLNPNLSTIASIDSLEDIAIYDVPLLEPAEVKLQQKTPSAYSPEFCQVAVSKLIENCAFIHHCQEDAKELDEEHWWAMVHQLVAFGEPGNNKIHELSKPYQKTSKDGKVHYYSEIETEAKIRYAQKAYQKEIGPHTCATIQEKLGFRCSKDCLVKELSVSSPAGLASKLASLELAQKRTNSLDIAAAKNGKREVKVNCPLLAEEIMRDYSFKTLRDTEEILVYQEGVYRSGGGSIIKEEVKNRLFDLTTSHRLNEVLTYITVSTYVNRSEFNQGEIMNLENGLLNIRASELMPHTPNFLSTIRIPVKYNPKGDAPRIRQFFQEIVAQEDIPLLEEIVGYCLEPSYYIHRAFLLVGEGANGKSTFLELLRSFLGRESCSTIPLQLLETHRFASAALFGKLANLYADVPSTMMKHVGVFKMLTGGDTVYAEKKFQEAFSFNNFAKLIFSTNKPPEVKGEDTYAFWRRWIIINFPNQFIGDHVDKTILQKLTTEQELSGLLNLALEALHRLQQKQEFSYRLTPDEVAETYLKAANPIYAFITERCAIDPESWVSKDDLYKAYQRFCHDNKVPIMGKESFGRALKNSIFAASIRAERRRIEEQTTYGWRGIQVSFGFW